jgi:hypothetical protein
MAGEWRRHEVSKLIETATLLIGDVYRAKNGELGDHGLAFARAGNINDGFQFNDADRFPEANLARVGNREGRLMSSFIRARRSCSSGSVPWMQVLSDGLSSLMRSPGD